MRVQAINDQTIGSFVKSINDMRAEDLQRVLEEINKRENLTLSMQDENLVNALSKIVNIQDFIKTPQHILGSMQTKHGEIAEQVEVGIVNAKQALKGLADRATFEGVGRTAPEDYILDGSKVQSKFINGELNTLKHVLEHLKNYEDISFARGDGSFYHIPKDQFSNIIKILNENELEGRSVRSVNAILREIENIENESGQRFTDIVKAANTSYDEVQLGKIDETIDNIKKGIIKENESITDNIKKNAQSEREYAADSHKANFSEASKAAAVGAAISGGMTLVLDIYRKTKEGKKVSDFTADDWKEIGLDTGKKTARGAVTGYAIYGLTNLANMPAPVASGLVSATIGMTSLINDFRKGNLDFDGFVEESELLCIDTSVVVLGSMLGQALIPIPVIGSVIGSVVSNVLLDVAKNVCSKKEMELLEGYKARYHKEMADMEAGIKEFIEDIVDKYKKLGGILQMAFSQEINVDLRFSYSRQLAIAYGVPEPEVLKDEKNIDNFFLI